LLKIFRGCVQLALAIFEVISSFSGLLFNLSVFLPSNTFQLSQLLSTEPARQMPGWEMVGDLLLSAALGRCGQGAGRQQIRFWWYGQKCVFWNNKARKTPI
ncbi:MAG: hypothetical protein LUF81_05760, partial [Clostridiales bacterium]|nr:hypothetical protein [Clostridiales bacterium]